MIMIKENEKELTKSLNAYNFIQYEITSLLIQLF